MLLLLDNYDSFTYNLAHYLGELGAEIVVRRNDALTAAEAVALNPAQIVLSPGPCRPEQAGIMLDLIKLAGERRIPLLGVCLGHQGIGMVYGGQVVRAEVPMHGKMSFITHQKGGLFTGIPSPYAVARYHSLIVEKTSIPAELRETASTEDGIIMALQHQELPVYGVQFHPESIATEHGYTLIKNFLDAR